MKIITDDEIRKFLVSMIEWESKIMAKIEEAILDGFKKKFEIISDKSRHDSDMSTNKLFSIEKIGEQLLRDCSWSGVSLYPDETYIIAEWILSKLPQMKNLAEGNNISYWNDCIRQTIKNMEGK